MTYGHWHDIIYLFRSVTNVCLRLKMIRLDGYQFGSRDFVIVKYFVVPYDGIENDG